jgi:hypothetical protein
MPLTLSLYGLVVWFLVGLFVGAGWTFGAWLISRLTR